MSTTYAGRLGPVGPNGHAWWSGAAAPAVSQLTTVGWPHYAGACRAAATVLVPGGRFAHVGVHPCFIGAFADRSDPQRVLLRPGYWRRERSFDAWCPQGVRARMGAVHLPLSDLIAVVIGAGLAIDELVEGR